MPYSTDNDTITHRYPFNSKELLCSETSYIRKTFLEETLSETQRIEIAVKADENKFGFIDLYTDSSGTSIKEYKLIEFFFDFLTNKTNNQNYLLCTYFTQILKAILESNNSDEKNIIIKILFEKNKLYITSLINLCYNDTMWEGIFAVINILLENKNNNENDNENTAKIEFILTEIFSLLYKNDYFESICKNFFPLAFTRTITHSLGGYLYMNFKWMKKIRFTQFNGKENIFMVINTISYDIKGRLYKETEDASSFEGSELNKKENDYILQNIQQFIEYLYDAGKKCKDYILSSEKDNIHPNKSKEMLIKINILDFYYNFTMIINETIRLKKDNTTYLKYIINLLSEKLLYIFINNIFENQNNNIYHSSVINFVSCLNGEVMKEVITDEIVLKLVSYFDEIYPNFLCLLAPISKLLYIIFSYINKEEYTEIKNVIMQIMKVFNGTLLYSIEKNEPLDIKASFETNEPPFYDMIAKQLVKITHNDNISEEIAVSDYGNECEEEIEEDICQDNDSIGEIIQKAEETAAKIYQENIQKQKEEKRYNDVNYWRLEFSEKEKEKILSEL